MYVEHGLITFDLTWFTVTLLALFNFMDGKNPIKFKQFKAERETEREKIKRERVLTEEVKAVNIKIHVKCIIKMQTITSCLVLWLWYLCTKPLLIFLIRYVNHCMNCIKQFFNETTIFPSLKISL